MNKYRSKSKANLTRNLRENLRQAVKQADRRIDHQLDASDYDELHKEDIEKSASRVSRVFGVARQLFEMLSESGLSAGDRDSAVKLFNTLHHTMGQR